LADPPLFVSSLQVPVLAAVLSFITYSLSGHELDAATIFSSLQLFNVIRQPLVMLPMALTVTSDAYAALKRIATLLLAEDLASARIIDPSLEHAISAHGDFTWEASQEGGGIMGGKGGGGRGGKDYEAIRKKKAEEKRRKKEEKERKKKGLPKVEKGEGEGEKGEEKEPFGLRDIDLDVKRGDLVCIVGEVGSGKSSLLQALIGEMKKLKGEVIFGGSTAYVSQIRTSPSRVPQASHSS
jgi:ATP-binding cassette subfamily C (CFTR/MRP) protein 1